jgi:hypothetical protein
MVKNNKKQKIEKPEDEKEIEEAPILTLYERWDINNLEMISLLVLDPQLETTIDRIVEQTKKSRMEVTYKPSTFKKGRLYSNGLQSVPGWIKRICADGFYHDIDIVNCGPTITDYLFKNAKFDSELDEYVKDRSKTMQYIREDPFSTQFKDYTDDQMKKVIIKICNGGGYKCKEDGINFKNAVLDTMSKSIKSCIDKLMLAWSNRDLLRYVEDLPGNKDKTHKNMRGQFISYMVQEIECKIVLQLHAFFNGIGKKVGVLTFDGLMIERESNGDMPSNILTEAQRHVALTCGISIKLKEKSLKPTAADRRELYGVRCQAKMKPQQRAIYMLWRMGGTNELCRLGDKVHNRHPIIPGVIKPLMENCDYVNQILLDMESYTSTGGSMKMLLEWMSTVDHPTFPLLFDRLMPTNAVSLIDGSFDINLLEFTPWDEFEGKPPCNNWYFESNLPDILHFEALPPTVIGDDPNVIERDRLAAVEGSTPFWNKIVDAQLVVDGNREVVETLEMLIGRLFFKVNEHDRYQIIPFLKGDSQTGKSTVCNIIKAMFPQHSVGHITATHEPLFGLEALHTKRLILIPDLPKNFHLLVNQSDFQSMVSGEGVSVARKNKVAQNNIDWTVPLFAAGNYLPSYCDNSGSLSRRLVVFPFVNKVETTDTNLEQKIIANELFCLLYRCILRYWICVKKNKGKEFWTFAPTILHTMRQEIKSDSNFLARFLQDGDDYYQIIHQEGAVTSIEDLGRAYSNHMKFTHKKDRETLSSDHFPIKNAGFIIKTISICKVCGLQLSSATCGAHYNIKNRTQKIRIIGMKILSKQ